ncbi:MAG: EMC3/TMCO1 family protein [Ferroplasma sp.]
MQPNNNRPAPNPQMTKFMMIEFIFMFAGLGLIFIISDPSIRNPIGKALNYVFMPVLGFNYNLPILTLMLTGIILGLISSIPRYFFTDWIKMGKAQLVSKAYSKAQREAFRSGDRARQQKLQKLSMQRQMDQAALSMNTMKPLMVTEIFFFLIFIWLYVFMLSLPYDYVSLPWNLNLNIVTAKIYIMPLWMGLYTLGNLAVGYFVTMIMKYVDFTYKLRKLDEETAQSL